MNVFVIYRRGEVEGEIFVDLYFKNLPITLLPSLFRLFALGSSILLFAASLAEAIKECM